MFTSYSYVDFAAQKGVEELTIELDCTPLLLDVIRELIGGPLGWTSALKFLQQSQIA